MKKSGFRFYASACGSGHGNWLTPLGGKSTDKLEDADVIIFGGGADIEPATYNETASKGTWTAPEREAEERSDFKKGMELGKKFVGICRGHQLLCALAGGKLIQDVTNHSGYHSISTFDGQKVTVNSIHHQMISPYSIKDPKDYQILAWSTVRRSRHYIGAKNKTIYLPVGFKEIEAAYFPKINGLGFQYHPEMMYGGYGKNDAAVDWTQQTFIKFFEGKL